MHFDLERPAEWLKGESDNPLLSRNLMTSVLKNIEAMRVADAIQVLLADRDRGAAAVLGSQRSVYRQILFFLIRQCGETGIDIGTAMHSLLL